MKKLLPVVVMAMLCACNNSQNEKKTVSTDSSNLITNPQSPATSTPAAGSATMTYSIADTVTTSSASVLVQKDKDKLSPGNDNLAVVTSNSEGSSLVVNFLFATKPGIYPVVGLGLTKGNQVFGDILGGKAKITPYKVNLTECTDLGSNNLGGHKWKISGSIEEDITIDAMSIMKMSPGHPDNIKVSNIRFSNLTFDDNWEQIMEEGMKHLKKQSP